MIQAKAAPGLSAPQVRIGSIRVLSVRSELDPSAVGELEVSWGTRADQMPEGAIYVLGVLRAKGDSANSAVYVALVCRVVDGSADEDFTEEQMQELASSASVVHVLYDTAANITRQLLAIVQLGGAIPHLTPQTTWLEKNEMTRV